MSEEVNCGYKPPRPGIRRPLALACLAVAAAVPLAVAVDFVAFRIRTARVEAHAATAAELVAFADRAGLVYSDGPAERRVYVRVPGPLLSADRYYAAEYDDTGRVVRLTAREAVVW
jgi:hypothetical protein